MVLSHGAFGFNNYSCELVGEAVAHAAGGTAPYAPRPWAVARVGPRGADLRVAHCDRVSGCEVRPFVFNS